MAARSSRESGSTVTLSQIAELAGVRPSAVSNWRKRFDDFPRPVETGGGGRDVFSLTEAEAWLKKHDRFGSQRGSERLLFEAAGLLRGQVSTDDYLAILCSAIALAHVADRTGEQRPNLADKKTVFELVEAVEDAQPELRGLFEPLMRIDAAKALQVFELLRRLSFEDRPSAFESVLDRAQTRFAETRTSEPLRDLLIELAHEGAQVVLDPAAGEGGFLLAAAEASEGRARLLGQEVNQGTWTIARQRFLVHDIDVTIARGDSLSEDAFPGLRADVVLCDPPYGARGKPDMMSVADPRWTFGLPSVRSSDYFWLQHVIYHLADQGRGYVLLPTGSLYRRGREGEIRNEMIRRGAVEAVVSLPAGVARHTSIPLSLWILRQPLAAKEPPPVLLVDASGAAESGTDTTLGALEIRRISDLFRSWRQAQNAETHIPGFAAAVPVLELLKGEASLLPTRWVRYERTLNRRQRREEQEAAIQRFRLARQALVDADADTDPGDDLEPPRWESVRSLVVSEAAQVIRGARVRPEGFVAEGTRALRARDIRDGYIHDDDPRFVDLDRMKPRPTLTEPGDIILSPGGGEPRAAVDEKGGHVLVFPLQALRIRHELLDPFVAAAFLESPRNRRFVTGTTYGYARVDVRDLELPVLPRADAARVRERLERIALNERLARELAESSRALRETMLELAGYVPSDEEDSERE